MVSFVCITWFVAVVCIVARAPAHSVEDEGFCQTSVYFYFRLLLRMPLTSPPISSWTPGVRLEDLATIPQNAVAWDGTSMTRCSPTLVTRTRLNFTLSHAMQWETRFIRTRLNCDPMAINLGSVVGDRCNCVLENETIAPLLHAKD